MAPTLKRICVLGSTGSIGEKTIQVVGDHPDRFEIVGLSAHESKEALVGQVREIGPAAACLSGSADVPEDSGGVRWFSGSRGLLDLIEASRPDLVVVALVGAAGLMPTLAAIEHGVTVALANKEVLVTAGELVMRRAREQGVGILPIDSEHNAIFQCLDGRPEDIPRRVILTGSGGPFRGWSRARLESATLEDALKHPTWSMGPKITIDSATLMNKGFEVIEGHHLFGVDVDKFEVVIHPQSIVHSMVEFRDGSILAQLGVTDMYFPIAHILAYPERIENARFEPLDLAAIGSLDFERYDGDAFPCLRYAYEAARQGSTYPTVLNAANEVAVDRFLKGEIRFLEIGDIVDAVLQEHTPPESVELDDIQEADRKARSHAAALTFSKT